MSHQIHSTGIIVKTQPTVEPVSVAEQKLHEEIDGTRQDSTIAVHIKAARIAAEKFARRRFINATFTETWDRFPSVIRPGWSPLSSDVSDVVITYVDTDQATQTLSSSLYTVDVSSQPGRIIPAFGESWPSTLGHINDVSVEFVAGYGATSASVPSDIIDAIKLLAAGPFEFRESTSERRIFENPTVKALLWGFRLLEFPS